MDIIKKEEKNLENILKIIEKTNKEIKESNISVLKEIDRLKKERLDASFKEKIEIEEEIERHLKRLRKGAFVYEESPYFASFRIEDEDIGKKRYFLGKQTLFDFKGRAVIIDWREAAISRLYYEYEDEEEYDEEINNKERSGIIYDKTQYTIINKELRSIKNKKNSFSKINGKWVSDIQIEKKKELEDFSLQDIAALISPEQFRLITQEHKGGLYLTGSAGSGKTTVAIHRLSYFIYHKKFKPSSCLVVMINKSLKNYTEKLVRDIIGSEVKVLTLASFLAREIRPKNLTNDPLDIKNTKSSKEFIDFFFENKDKFSSSKEAYIEFARETKNNSFLKYIESQSSLSYFDLNVEFLLKKSVQKYEHIILDEAQDLGKLELECIKKALDKNKSITICADLNQRIFSFSDPESLIEFEKSIKLSLEKLEVGYRCPKEILEFAKSILENKNWIKNKEFIYKKEDLLKEIKKLDKKELSCIITASRKEASRLKEKIKEARLEFENITFSPGLIITDIYHVKGLEFFNVFVYDPLSFSENKSFLSSRLYVAATRAMKSLKFFI